MPRAKKTETKPPVKVGCFKILAFTIFIIIPAILFCLTQFFWHYFYPIEPDYPQKLFPKYAFPGDMMYELFNLNALFIMSVGWILFITSLRPKRSFILGFLFGVGTYLLFGVIYALIDSFRMGAYDVTNILVGVLFWPVEVCNCWLY